MQGWIKLHREVRSNWLYQEKRQFSKFEAWVDILLEVNHKDSKVLIGSELVEVKRGQTITSIRQLCGRWGWSNTKVKQFLLLLEEDGMAFVKSDTKKTVITVEKYDFYQQSEEEKTTEKHHGNDTETSQKHTNKNVKNEKNDKEGIKPSCRKSKIYDQDSLPYKLSFRLLQKIKENIPDFKEPNMQKWSDDMRLMLERDKRTSEQISYLIDWCQRDSFWKANILSPAKLRKQFDQLVVKVKSANEKPVEKRLKLIHTQRPSHLPEPKFNEELEENIEEKLEDLPY